jgi:predicted RNase H-like HicB family nuclease
MMRTWTIKKASVPMKIWLALDGSFMGEFPALPGCEATGKTYDDVVLNLAKAIQLRLEVVPSAA